jgi:hypothetical protein
MIRFFRRLRLNALSQKRFTKYSSYAIGEIVLVVIGILIALQINNWNDKQSNLENVENAIDQVVGNLEEDIASADNIYKQNVYVDSIAAKVLADEYTARDYKENYRLFWVGLQYIPFDYQVAGINSLENLQNIIPSKHKDIVNEIYKFYIAYGERYNKSFEIERNNTTENHRFLLETQDWYYLLRDKRYDDEMIDFYLNSPKYKNMVAMYKSTNREGGYAREYQVGAVQLLLKIREHLESTTPLVPAVEEMLGQPQNTGLEKFEGKYLRDDGEISEIKSLAGYLTFDGTLLKHSSENNYNFVFRKDNRLEFKMQDGEAIELEYYAPMFVGRAKKIKDY